MTLLANMADTRPAWSVDEFEQKLRDKGTASAAKRVSPLVRQTGLSRTAIVDALFRGFQAAFGGTVDRLTHDELAAAAELVSTKYGTAEWTGEFE